MGKRIWTYKKVSEYIESQGCKLLSDEFITVKEKLKIQCSCGNTDWECTFTNFLRGRRCKACGKQKLSQSKINSNEKVKEIIENEGCKWIGGEYSGNTSKLLIECGCGNKFNVLFCDFQNGTRCRECGYKKLLQKIHKRYVRDDNNLLVCYPDLCAEWDYEKNGNVLPENIAPKTSYDAWWICPNGHSYQCKVRNRTSLNRGCSYCAKSNGKPSKDNNLAIIHPYLVQEWDYTKNIKNPEDYLPRSSKEVFWECSQCHYKWSAVISNRVAGTGCPACGLSGGAKSVLYFLKNNAILFDIEYEFNDLLSDLGNPLRYDFAVFDDFNNLKMLIEYDGGQHEKFCKLFHKDEEDFLTAKKYDQMKDEYAFNHKIDLLRIGVKQSKDIENILNEKLNLQRKEDIYFG